MRMDVNTFGIGCSPFRLTASRAAAWLKAQRAAAAHSSLFPTAALLHRYKGAFLQQ